MNRVKQVLVTALSALVLFAVGVASANTVDEIVYFHPNALGSATAAYNEAGQECWSQDYTPYGEKIDPLDGFPASGCGLLGGERGYTGHVQDTTGLVYMQQRYYDPTLMRFLSIDPVGVSAVESKTFNRYAYAGNNPYRYVDPDGEAFVLAVLAPFAGTTTATTATASSGIWGGWLGAVAGGAGLAGLWGYFSQGEDEDLEEDLDEDKYDEYADLESQKPRPTRSGKLKSKPGPLGEFRGADGLRDENDQVRSIGDEFDLSDDQRDKLHGEIQKEQAGTDGTNPISRETMRDIARDIKGSED